MSGEPDGLEISNEFTTIQVRKERTRNGERLVISSPRLGHAVRLDPLALEGLTWQPLTTFSTMLETPYGPDDLTDGRPLSDLLPGSPEGAGPGDGDVPR